MGARTIWRFSSQLHYKYIYIHRKKERDREKRKQIHFFLKIGIFLKLTFPFLLLTTRERDIFALSKLFERSLRSRFIPKNK